MYDVIGDVHGCFDEMIQLIRKLGYHETSYKSGIYKHPEGRQLVFVGDITDRGPQSMNCLDFVLWHRHYGHALTVEGNHDNKLKRWFKGNPVKVTGGLATTVAEIEDRGGMNDVTKRMYYERLNKWPRSLDLDDGRLIVCHAAPPVKGRSRKICLYGHVDHRERDENGYPIRQDWTLDYEGDALVAYGHITCSMDEPYWSNNTVCLDTSAVFGGRLTALRYPELQIVQVDCPKYAEH